MAKRRKKEVTGESIWFDWLNLGALNLPAWRPPRDGAARLQGGRRNHGPLRRRLLVGFVASASCVQGAPQSAAQIAALRALTRGAPTRYEGVVESEVIDEDRFIITWYVALHPRRQTRPGRCLVSISFAS